VTRDTKRLRTASAFWLAASALIAFQALWPADAPWINDEPGLIYKAMRANQAGTLETVGLMGSVGLPYGPHVTWVYQGALLFTHDLVAIVVAKSLLTAVILLWGLLEVGRAVNLRRQIALVALLSPFLFFYGRVLWDNVFLLPASALLFAAAARCFRSPSLPWWSLGVFSAYLLFHIHLMSMFVLVPALAIVPLACWPWLRANWGKALAPVAVAAAASYPYVSILLAREYSGGVVKPELWQRLLASLSGIELYSFGGFFEYFAPEYAGALPAGAALLKALTMLCLPLYGAGLVICASALARAIRRRSFGPRDWMDALSLGCVGTAAVFAVAVGLDRQHPHHLNSIGLPVFYFFWRAADRYWSRRWMRAVTGAYATAMGLLLLLFVLHIHHNGGNRARHYGPTLGNQIEIAREVARSGAPRPFEFRAGDYGRYEHRLTVLLLLMDALPELTAGPPSLAIEYVDPRSGDGRLRVAVRRKR
jgi:hypothetical protein